MGKIGDFFKKVGDFFKKGWNKSKYGDVLTTGGAYTTQLLNEEAWGKKLQSANSWQMVPQEKRDQYYKKVINEILTPIVQSDNPLLEIRKAILSAIRTSVSSYSMFTKENGEIRSDDEIQLLYEAFSFSPSPFGDDVSISQPFFRMYMESEPVSVILILVYKSCFEKTGSEYWGKYQENWREVIITIINKKLGKEDEASLKILDPSWLSSLDKVHRDLLNEPFGVDLDSPFKS